MSRTTAVLSRAQRVALKRVYDRGTSEGTYLRFRRTAQYDHLLDCVMVGFCGMLLGIERDGYTHS